MCSVSKMLNPVSMLPGGNNPIVNPASLVTNSSNKLVNPLGSLLSEKKSAPAQPAAAGSLTAPVDPAQKKPSSLLGG